MVFAASQQAVTRAFGIEVIARRREIRRATSRLVQVESVPALGQAVQFGREPERLGRFR